MSREQRLQETCEQYRTSLRLLFVKAGSGVHLTTRDLLAAIDLLSAIVSEQGDWYQWTQDAVLEAYRKEELTETMAAYYCGVDLLEFRDLVNGDK